MGLLATIVGMSFTFLTLALISFSSDLLRIVFQRLDKSQKSQKMEKVENHQQRAIIAAAIAAYTSSDPDRIVIHKISEESPDTMSPWKLTGREELMDTR